MTNYEFEAWLIVNKEAVETDWKDYVDSVGITELWETTGLTKDSAIALKASDATEAFRDFALSSFEDSRDFSNSGL